MATHSSILACKIPWTERPGGLQSKGLHRATLTYDQAFQVASVVKNPPANAGDVRDMGSIPGLGISPGTGRGSPFQYFCLENPMDRGAWQATQSIGSQGGRHDLV